MKNICLLLFSQLVFSQLQVNSFYPTFGASGNYFGRKVDINNNEVVVSSGFNNSFNQLGKVYVFDFNNNSLIQTDVLIESDVNGPDRFGSSISKENDKIAIGAPNQGANNSNLGAVYLYRKINGNYQSHQKITSINNTNNDTFGRCVKLFDNRLYISSKNNVYVFDLLNSVWTLSQTLSVVNETDLGTKIEVSNNQLLISSGHFSGNNSTKIYNFNLVNNLWNYQSTFDYSPNQIFSYKLYNSQLYILDDASGLVSIYDFSNNDWILNSSFQIPLNDQIYDEIVVNNESLFLGSNAYMLQMSRKFALLHYKKNNGVWTSQTPIYSNETNAQVDDFFGSSMALEGDKLIIGCPGEYSPGPSQTGRAYYVDTTLSLEDNFLSAFYFYPNPTKDILHIENDFIDKIESVSIFQIDGKKVATIESNFESINLTNLTKGAYFFKISFDNNEIITRKIIKQ
ncbi:MAG: hypothetical protein RLZZ469_1859 [Bacteroidota bacterium]